MPAPHRESDPTTARGSAAGNGEANFARPATNAYVCINACRDGALDLSVAGSILDDATGHWWTQDKPRRTSRE